MKFAVIALIATVAAVDDASVATDAVCTADKECKVATEACCQTFASSGDQTTATAKAADMQCQAGITVKQTVKPFMNKCVARVAAKGASKLALGLSAVAAALYMA